MELEIILNNIDLEGAGKGYDLACKVIQALDIPLIALGGAANVDNMIQQRRQEHMVLPRDNVCFQGHKGVLITYLSTEQINKYMETNKLNFKKLSNVVLIGYFNKMEK